MRLIDADKLNETFGNSLFFDEDNQCRINEIIDNAPTVEAVQLDFHEKCMDMTVKEMLEKPTESEIVKAYTKGFDTGVETARTKGEYIEEDILQIIKENFDIGYEMAKNRYERPKGEWQPLGIATPDIRCSKCGCIVAFNYHKTPFCPGCGADMRGDIHDDK